MNPHAVLLVFLILSGSGQVMEDGDLHARSCAAGEQYLREALRSHQLLEIVSCQAVARVEAGR